MIATRMQPYIEIGFRHFIFDVPYPFDQETVERLIGDVKPSLSA